MQLVSITVVVAVWAAEGVAAINVRGRIQIGSPAQDLSKCASVPNASPTEDKVQKWWDNNADKEFQHLDRAWVEQHNKEWPKFLQRFDWKNKRVLDYGIGAGYLGETLLVNYNISQYIGIDISYKALQATRETLGFAKERVTLCEAPQQLVSFAPDIIVSQQVIQHFPSIEYLQDFLGNVDKSHAGKLMLQFRQSDSKQTIVNNAYERPNEDPIMALMTDVSFLQSHLHNYVNVWHFSSPMCCNTVGMWTGWTRKHK